MGIGIEWAKINQIRYAKLEKEEEEERKFKRLKELRQELDKQISLKIDKILIAPCYLYLNFNFSIDDLLELRKEYTDFTIEYYFQSRNSVSVKLADKDWDWQGYGIKKQGTIPSTPKKWWQIWK